MSKARLSLRGMPRKASGAYPAISVLRARSTLEAAEGSRLGSVQDGRPAERPPPPTEGRPTHPSALPQTAATPPPPTPAGRPTHPSALPQTAATPPPPTPAGRPTHPSALPQTAATPPPPTPAGRPTHPSALPQTVATPPPPTPARRPTHPLPGSPPPPPHPLRPLSIVSTGVPLFKFSRTMLNDDDITARVTGIEVSYKLVAVRRCAKTDLSNFADDEREPTVQDILAVSGFRGKASMDGTCVVHRYMPSQERWEKYAKVPEGRLNFAVAYLQRCLYVIGGYNPKEAVNGVRATTDTFRYDPSSDSWDSVGDLNIPRSFHSVCSVGGHLYAVGGHDDSNRVLKSVEVYDPSEERWSLIHSMSCGRVGASCVAYKGRVVVTGGYGEVTNDRSPCPVLHTMECFDPATSRWELAGHLRVPRAQACLLCVRDCLYLCGGVGRDPATGALCSMRDVDRYDADTNEWTHVTDLQTARHNAGAVAIGLKLYVMGGFSTVANEFLRSIEYFNIGEQTWENKVQCLPRLAMSLACVVVPGTS